MYPYMNEDVAWQRQLDIQREVENSRLAAAAGDDLLGWVLSLAEIATALAGQVAAWAQRRRAARWEEAASDEDAPTSGVA
jgi:hypothetical protein